MNVLVNPWYRSGSVLAKLAVNWSTMVWSFVLLLHPSAIESTAYDYIVKYFDSRWLAGPMFCLAVVQIVWLVFRWQPFKYSSIGYGIMTVLWLFILYTILIRTVVQPTLISCVSAVVGLAVLAFVTNPKGKSSVFSD